MFSSWNALMTNFKLWIENSGAGKKTSEPSSLLEDQLPSPVSNAEDSSEETQVCGVDLDAILEGQISSF